MFGIMAIISPIVILLSIVIVADLLLARQILVSNRRHPGNIFFSLVVFFAAVWTFLMLVGERLAALPLLISWSLRLTYFFAVWIIFFFYLFTYYFPYKKTFHQLSKNTLLLLIGSSIFISIICLLPDVFISGYVLPEDRFTPEISRFWNGIYALYFIILFILSFRNLFFKYKNSSGFWRLRIKQILIATMVGFIGGMIFSLFIPLWDSNVVDWAGPVFTFFTVGYIWYHFFYKPKEGLKILSDFKK